MKLKEGEEVLELWGSFCEQMLEWDLKLESVLAREVSRVQLLTDMR
jgi:hypothetical protein